MAWYSAAGDCGSDYGRLRLRGELPGKPGAREDHVWQVTRRCGHGTPHDVSEARQAPRPKCARPTRAVRGWWVRTYRSSRHECGLLPMPGLARRFRMNLSTS